MGVNDVWLKVAEIPAKDDDGFYEWQRTTRLIEGEMADFELVQQWFMTTTGRSNHHPMTLLGLSDSEVDGHIDDAVAKVRYVVRYVQNPHLLFALLVFDTRRGDDRSIRR
jgi:hypothetical protein